MPAVSATLTGIAVPRGVLVVVTGLTIGDVYAITGSSGDWSWPVRAGRGTAAATQVAVNDMHTPINVPITYTVTVAGVGTTSSAVTVTYGRRYVLQTLRGDASVEFDMIRNNAPRALATRLATFYVPGRARPVTRHDVSGGESGSIEADTEDARTGTIKAMLTSGVPLVLRTDGDILDLDAVEFLAVSSVTSSLIGMRRRRWVIGHEVIDDPEPDTLVALSDWDDFDASYDATLDWDDFDAEWTGQTWDDLDLEDWATRAAGA
jgi:hypothetical protein